MMIDDDYDDDNDDNVKDDSDSDGFRSNPGDVCIFTCDDGYVLTGSDSMVCKNDGSWSDSPASCQSMYCLCNVHSYCKFKNLLFENILCTSINTDLLCCVSYRPVFLYTLFILW